jgi:hypothetical protein
MEVCDLLAGFKESWKYMKRHHSYTIVCVRVCHCAWDYSMYDISYIMHVSNFAYDQCCNWSGSLIGWLAGKASKS